MDDLSRFCCQNKGCPDYGKRGARNLTICGRYGKKRRKLLYCRTCKARFSERKGTVFFQARLPDEKIVSLLDHIQEGCGVRQTARLVGVNKETVVRYSRGEGQHSKDLHDELVAFSPRTTEGQFDEKWAFVGKKQKQCDPDDPSDARQGDSWDHVAYDPQHRLVLAVVPGKRSAQNVKEVVAEFKQRTDEKAIRLLTSDEYQPYPGAILDAYGKTVIPPRTGKPGRPRAAYTLPPDDLVYATVHKSRQNGRVVKVEFRSVFGSDEALRQALLDSAVSRQVNTAFIERHNGTDRNRNARKTRKSYCFSKDWAVHEGVTYFTMYSYNFCWPVRTLRQRDAAGHWHNQTPAMAAGLADHVWSLCKWLSYPAVQRK